MVKLLLIIIRGNRHVLEEALLVCAGNDGTVQEGAYSLRYVK